MMWDDHLLLVIMRWLVKRQEMNKLTETDSPEPSQQSIHSCVLVLDNTSQVYLKI